MKLCLAGKNDIAVGALSYILENKLVHKDDIIVIPNSNDLGRDTWVKSLKKCAENNNIKIKSLEEAKAYENLVFVSLEFDKIIKPKEFKTKRLYNIHFSLLPKYRGMYTSFWPIYNGESETAVTLHEIDEGIDTGAIINQRKFKIDIKDTAKDLYFNYNKYGLELFKNEIKNLLENKYDKYDQECINTSYYSKKSFDFSNIEVDLNRSTFQIYNNLRALIFKEFQLPKIKNERISEVQLIENKTEKFIDKVTEYDDYFIICGNDNYCIKAIKEKVS